ncbi:MAG: amino acid ABC transporter substrate-binding protein [Rothia mucilaginosa]|uniref:ABC transporter substrate-binding protein n=1 Tax=Rothia mucilaginosa TaxID=43675 RepID=UPI001E0A630E|nr:ABC transporter substrate-binding protein [Rothia mucilaginosa]MBS6433178.1 amino acid ABC transporter substrate-binding protein [Rothia mucilaginosa]
MNTAILKKVSLKPLTLLAVLPLALTGCVSTATDSSSSNSEVKLVKPGTLSVCTNTPYKPFEYEDNGTIVGLDADIANDIASDLGVKAQLTSISFEGLDSGTGLSTGQCDIALAGIGVTDARKSKMEFTTVYFDDNLAILVPKGSSITSAADLKGVAVGAQQATSGETYAKANGAQVIQYEDTSLMFSALKTGQVKAVAANLSVVSEALTNDPNSFKIAYQDSKNTEEIAAAVSSNNKALLAKANATIDKLKKNGELDKMKAKWVGTTSSTSASASSSAS